MKADHIQLALPPEMILLIRISSGAGNTEHLFASASASWVTVCRGEQTVPGRFFVPFLILYSTCYIWHLDCAKFRLTASWNSPVEKSTRHTGLLWRHINHQSSTKHSSARCRVFLFVIHTTHCHRSKKENHICFHFIFPSMPMLVNLSVSRITAFHCSSEDES